MIRIGNKEGSMLRLVLGGEKSGKSSYAQARFLEDPTPHRLLVTGKALDMAFREQIAQHRAHRPTSLFVDEVAATPEALPEAIHHAADAGVGALLIDSMDFWLFTTMTCGGRNEKADIGGPPMALLTQALTAVRSQMAVTLVSCEVGLGPIAADAATRRFIRQLGACNQALAYCCEQVVLVVAGLPLYVKGAQAEARE